MIEKQIELLNIAIVELTEEIKRQNKILERVCVSNTNNDSETILTYGPKTEESEENNSQEEQLEESQMTHAECRKFARMCLDNGMDGKTMLNKIVELGADRMSYLEEPQLQEFYDWLKEQNG